MKKSLLCIIASSVLCSLGPARQLGGVDSVLAFECHLVSAVGKTALYYDASEGERQVTGLRNGLIKVQYRLNSAGSYNIPMTSRSASQISLSGGPLARNQFLTLAFTDIVKSGTSSASGSVVLSTSGGSVFAPITVGAAALGTVYCPTVVVK